MWVLAKQEIRISNIFQVDRKTEAAILTLAIVLISVLNWSFKNMQHSLIIEKKVHVEKTHLFHTL